MRPTEAASVPCPHCHRSISPLDGSTLRIAFYACGVCEQFWTIRFDGRPARTLSPVLFGWTNGDRCDAHPTTTQTSFSEN
jgi:hypothetical protein